MRKISLMLILLIIFAAGCSPKPPQQKNNQNIIPVKVSKVELTVLDETLDYVGNIKAEDEATVYPKVSGKIIEKVKEDGSFVNKGEAIAYIDRDEVGLTFEKAPVESPVTGIVGRVFVDIGTNVYQDTAIALVVRMDRVKIYLDIPEKYLPQVSLNQLAKITVDAFPKQEFIGKVTKISPVVDVATRTAPIEITADNPGHRLNSGMFARAKLLIKQHQNVPIILKEAILGKAPNTYVYVIENNKAVYRKIGLGIRNGPFFEVTEGLKEGDLVVILGQQKLYDGADVRVDTENNNSHR